MAFAPKPTAFTIVCGLWLAGCADSSSLQGDAGGETDGGAETGVGCGNLRDSDCPEGSFCYGNLACDSVWECREQVDGARPPTCSAAAPIMVCDCSGFVTSRAAGCPHDRYAVSLEQQFGTLRAQLLGGPSPAPCDPTHKSFYPMTYRVRARGFAAYEGQSVLFRWESGGPGDSAPSTANTTRQGVQHARVQSGGFDATLGPIGAGKPTALYYFVDLDSNGFCSGEPAGSQRELEVDLAGGFYDYALAPPTGNNLDVCNVFVPMN